MLISDLNLFKVPKSVWIGNPPAPTFNSVGDNCSCFCAIGGIVTTGGNINLSLLPKVYAGNFIDWLGITVEITGILILVSTVIPNSFVTGFIPITPDISGKSNTPEVPDIIILVGLGDITICNCLGGCGTLGNFGNFGNFTTDFVIGTSIIYSSTTSVTICNFKGGNFIYGKGGNVISSISSSFSFGTYLLWILKPDISGIWEIGDFIGDFIGGNVVSSVIFLIGILIVSPDISGIWGIGDVIFWKNPGFKSEMEGINIPLVEEVITGDKAPICEPGFTNFSVVILFTCIHLMISSFFVSIGSVSPYKFWTKFNSSDCVYLSYSVTSVVTWLVICWLTIIRLISSLFFPLIFIPFSLKICFNCITVNVESPEWLVGIFVIIPPVNFTGTCVIILPPVDFLATCLVLAI